MSDKLMTEMLIELARMTVENKQLRERVEFLERLALQEKSLEVRVNRVDARV